MDEEPFMTFFFSCINVNVRGVPQSFLQGALASLRGLSPDLPDCQLHIERICRSTAATTPGSLEMYDTDIVSSANPSFAVGIHIPKRSTPSDATSDVLKIVLYRDQDKVEIGACRVATKFLVDQVNLGASVIHLPFIMRKGNDDPPTIIKPIMLNPKDPCIVVSVMRMLPVPHPLMHTQDLLQKAYSFPGLKHGPPRRVAEEVMEVEYHTSVPKVFLQHMHTELLLFTQLWQIRLQNERKRQLVFDCDGDALAAGCDVFHVAIVEARNLRSEGIVLAKITDGNNSPTPGLLNPFIKIEFGETEKPLVADGPPPSTPMEYIGRTPTEMSTCDPVWGTHRRTSVASNPKFTPIKENNQLANSNAPKIACSYSIYRRTHSQTNSKGVFHFDVFHEGINKTIEVSVGHIIVPWRIIKMKSTSMDPEATVPDAESDFVFEVDDWVPIYPHGDRRSMIGDVEPVGEIHVRISIRCSRARFEFENEGRLGPFVDQTPLFRMADKTKDHELRKRSKKNTFKLPTPTETTSIPTLVEHVTMLESYLVGLERMLEEVGIRDREHNWFRSSKEKKELIVQPLATNLHLSYFRLFEDIPNRPFAQGITTFRGTDLLRSLGSNRDGPPLDAVNSIQATISCGAPTAHALGLDKYGLLDLEDEMMAADPNGFDKAKHLYIYRKILCTSQSLSVLMTSFMASLEMCFTLNAQEGRLMLEQWSAIGYLFEWESLVSSQGRELRMLSDSWVAIKCLERFVFQFEQKEERQSFYMTTSPDSKDYIIHIPLDSVYFQALPGKLQQGQTITVVPVLFSQGINEMQSFANMMGSSGIELQHKINQKSFRSLESYVQDFISMQKNLDVSASVSPSESLKTMSSLLQSETMANAKKNTQLLLEASDIVRLLNGGRVTFCKSGKDRTAMSITLDQMRKVYGTSSDTAEIDELVKPIASIMREFGVRIEIAEKNIGTAKYSFNSLQRKMLPKMYRPPFNSIQGIGAKGHT
ncbi:inositol-3,4-bisphosphate 4-phosphatase [Thraustotheca clavata]|uniref:Inositol-3,4-bisphosphate 4-phosphatase n=1 Tax=Thraustotheca clavata TaxID=74557 RepID=A0A1V9ZD97_9STRA|nr:inositol-3,4-bisphosphate 4-phosphatase [Thraustotheca clavata]